MGRTINLLLGSALLLVACVQTASEMKANGPVSTIKMKGDYESAAHCFSREWRNNWKTSISSFYGFVEVNHEQKVAEYITMPRWIVEFRDAENGNSVATTYLSTMVCRSCWDRYLREHTASCQVP